MTIEQRSPISGTPFGVPDQFARRFPGVREDATPGCSLPSHRDEHTVSTLCFKWGNASLFSLAICLAYLFDVFNGAFASEEPKVVPNRRVYVPIEELDVVVEKDARGVLLPKAEFQALVKLAQQNAAANKQPPAATVLPQCDYTAKIVGDQLLITAKAALRQFHPDWQAWTFPLQRVAVERAKIDDAAAFIGRGSNGELALLTPDAGQHRLELELSTELVTLGSDQAAAFSLLGSATGELRITVPAGKRLLVDGLQWERPAKIDEPADYRLPIGGRTQIQLRITDRSAERTADALMFATTGYGLHVAPGEVTWHALTTLSVFGRPIDRVTLSVPGYLEIADVESTGLDSWQLSDDPGNKERTLIALTFGQPFEGQRKLTLRGVMPTNAETPWTVPALVIAQSTSHVGQIVVQHPAGVRLQIVETEGVRRATREQKPVSDMPDDMNKLLAVDSLRFDAWREDFTLKLVTQPKQRELHAAVAAILDAAAAGLDWQVALTLTTKFAPLFEVDFTVPVEWTISAATAADGQPLRWELLPGDAGKHRIRVRLPGPVPAGGATVLKLQLRRDVEGWPVEATPVEFPVPEITLPQATLTETAFVIRGDDDLELVADDVVGLDAVPLKADFERLRFQSQDTHYSGRLKVTRKPARIAAQQMAYYRIDPQTVHAALFAQVTVLGGGARDLLVTLPEEVGATVRFRAQGALLVEQQQLTVENSRRRWRLKFAERVRGSIVLATELELPRTAEPTVKAPVLAVADAEREFGAFVVEAGPEQRISIAAFDALGQPLSEMDPLDLPGVPYLPKERIVAVYRTVTPGASLALTEERFDKAAVPTAVCHSLAMLTILSRTGEVQQRAEYRLQLAGVQQLLFALPADAQFWGALLDGEPVEVRRSKGGYLIPVPGSGTGVVHAELELFYRQREPNLGGSGQWSQSPPTLNVLSGQGTTLPVEILQQSWNLVHPEDTLVIEAHGPVEPLGKLDIPGWLAQFREWLHGPRWDDVGFVAFCVAVISGGLAFLVLMYRRSGSTGVFAALGVVALLAFLSLLMLPAVQQSKRAAARYAITSSPPAGALVGDMGEERYDGYEMAPMAAPAATPMAVDDFAAITPPALAEPMGEAGVPIFGKRPYVSRLKRDAMDSESRDKNLAAEHAPARRLSEAELQKSDGEREDKSGAKDAKTDRLRERTGLDRSRHLTNPQFAPGNKPSEPAVRFANPAVPLGEPVQRGGDLVAQQLADQPAGVREALGLEVRQTQQVLPAKPMAGLLSLALQLEKPPHVREKSFRYVGTGGDGDATLNVEYLDRRSGTALRWFCLALGALLAWFARCLRFAAKIAVIAVGLAITCGLLPLMPVGWHVLWDGLFGAVCGATAIWLVHGGTQVCSRCCPWKSAALLALLLLPLASSRIAEAQEKSGKAPVARAPGFDGVIVPYDNVEAPLAAERVWLPHDKYIELYRLAHPEKAVHSPAPEHGGVVDAVYVAELAEEAPRLLSSSRGADRAVNVTARLTVRSYVDGQWSVTLPVRGVAITDAKLNGEPAAVGVPAVAGPPSNNPAEDRLKPGLQLIIPKPGLHVLDLKFAVPAKLTGAAGSFSLTLLPTPAAKLSFMLPQPKDSVRVNGSTSAYRRVTQGEQTLIEVPVDRGGDLSVSWQPEQSQGGGAAVIHVDSVTAVTLNDAGVTASAGFRYRVRQGIVRDVSFALPEAVKLQAVSGPDVGGWEVVGDGPQRKLRVFLRRNVGDTTQLTIDGYLGHRVTSEPSTFVVPDIAPQEITAEVGHVVVYTGEQFSVRAEQVQQLQQLNIENFQPEIPVTRADAAPQVLYRFSRRPWSVTLRTSRLATQVHAALQQGFWVTQRKVQTTNRVVCDLQRVPQSTIDLKVPAEWVILDVQSGYLKDWYLTKTDDAATVTVEFDQPRQGQVELVLLATESRDPTQPAVPLRTLSVRGAQKHQRQAAVWFDAGLAGQATSLGGWKSLDPSAMASELRTLRATAIQLAFQSTADDPGDVGLTVTQASPKLSANALTSISVTDVALIYGFVWQWQVDAAAVDTFAVETPNWLAGRLDFTGGNLREVTSAPAGQGRIRWTVALRGPVTGRFAVAATATLPPALDRINAPTVTFFGTNDTRPLEVQRQFVLLINTSLNQLTAVDPSLAEPVQREDVPIVVRQELVNQATEFVRVKSSDAAPAWTLQRYVAAAATQASVNLADLVTVLARDGTYRAAATYTIKNRGRQFLAVQLPNETRLLSVAVQGRASRAVLTKLDGQPTYLVALPKTSAADLSFPVQLAYAGKLAHGLPGRREVTRQEIDLPAPKVVEDHADFGIHVARTRWTVYLPEDLDAAPLEDPKKTNLNRRLDAATDDTMIRVLMQDYSDLLSTLDNSSSMNPRSVAVNNLKQLGTAINSYSRQLQSDRKLAHENEKLQERFNKLNVNALHNPVYLSDVDNAMDGISDRKGINLEVRSSDAQQQLSNAIVGNSAIISDNRGEGLQVEQQVDQNFNFRLQNPVPEKPAAAKAAETAAKQMQLRGNNLDARQQYQAANGMQLDMLNRDLSEKKSRQFSPEQQQMQFGRSMSRKSGGVTASGPEAASGSGVAAGRQTPSVNGQPAAPSAQFGGNVYFDSSPLRGQSGTLLLPQGMMGGGMGGLGGGFGGGGGNAAGFTNGLAADGAHSWFDNGRGQGVAMQELNADADELMDFGLQQLVVGQPGPAGGRSAAAGLSLPFDLPHTGQSLVFTKALGEPKLALAIRPHQSVNWLIGAAWALGWIAAAVTLLVALRTARGAEWTARTLPLLVAAVGALGMLVLAGPLNAAATVLFVIAAIVTAWQNRKPLEAVK